MAERRDDDEGSLVGVRVEVGFFGRYFRGQRQETGGGGVVPAYSRKNCAPVESAAGISVSVGSVGLGIRRMEAYRQQWGRQLEGPIKSRVPWKTHMILKYFTVTFESTWSRNKDRLIPTLGYCSLIGRFIKRLSPSLLLFAASHRPLASSLIHSSTATAFTSLCFSFTLMTDVSETHRPYYSTTALVSSR